MSLRPPEAPLFLREMLSADPARLTAFAAAFWPHMVGAEVGLRTRVVKLEKSTLVIEVPDASWQKELHRLQPSLVRRLRELLGPAAPRRLGFMQARGGFMPAKAARTEHAPSPTPSAAILEAAGTIPDESIREAFIRTATNYLSAGARRAPGGGGTT